MDATHTEDIKKHVRKYIMVFVALMALTVVTVAISYLHLSITAAVTVALIVATVKATLVASYFMHLISEKKVIYATLLLTVAFFALLMLLPTLTDTGSTKLMN
jgi:cytochrome c oxidase subunit 4